LRRPLTSLSGYLFLSLAPCLLLLVLSSAPARAAKELRDGDAAVYRDAFAAADRGQWPTAIKRSQAAGNPILVDYFRWRAFLQGGGEADFATIAAFIDSHSTWPGLPTLRWRAEEALTGREPAALVIEWFKDHPPRTGSGKMLLAEDLQATGATDRATALAREAWTTEVFPRVDERRFLARFGDVLTAADHAKRLDMLLWAGHAESARRMFLRVPEPLRRLAQARLALHGLDPGVDHLVAAVPKALRDDPGLVYERLRWRRLKGLDERAAELLDHPAADRVHPELWWRERHVLARRFLEKGWYSKAYSMAAGHGAEDGAALAEAEWLAGWLALRFLKEPKTALSHFTRMHDAVSYPISLGRAAYWAGRAAEALGDTAAAKRWYGEAAVQGTTYYGQLAASRLTPGAVLTLPASATPTPEARRAFEASPLVPLIRTLFFLDRPAEARPFLHALLDQAADDAGRVLAITLAGESGQPHLGTALARSAALQGPLVIEAAYPIPDIAWPPEPERALLLALIRQESNFHPGAISSAGARGLMQLMPRTARLVAQQSALSYDTGKLTDDPSYNVTVGAAYLRELLGRFKGSYVLALAGYNAGPGRPSQWMREFGDPRQAEVDAIDWVEMIPFPETRNYVQRILESLQIYRHLLSGAAPTPEQDLER
jgi:soluble lytic murein transglycosylase